MDFKIGDKVQYLGGLSWTPYYIGEVYEVVEHPNFLFVCSNSTSSELGIYNKINYNRYNSWVLPDDDWPKYFQKVNSNIEIRCEEDYYTWLANR